MKLNNSTQASIRLGQTKVTCRNIRPNSLQAPAKLVHPNRRKHLNAAEAVNYLRGEEERPDAEVTPSSRQVNADRRVRSTEWLPPEGGGSYHGGAAPVRRGKA